MEENKNLEGQVQQNQEPENKPEEHEMTLEEAQTLLAQERAKNAKLQNDYNKTSSEAANYRKQLKAEEAKERHTKELEEKLAKIDAQKRYMAIGMSEEMAEEAATAELAGESDKVTELYKKFNNASIKAAQAEWQRSRPPVNAGQGEDGKEDPFLKGFNG